MDRSTLLLILVVAVFFLISQRFTGAEARTRKLRAARKKILELKADYKIESNPIKRNSMDREIVYLEKVVEDLTTSLGFAPGDELYIKESLKAAKEEFLKSQEELSIFEKEQKAENDRVAKEHAKKEKELMEKARTLEKQEKESKKRLLREANERAKREAREAKERAKSEAREAKERAKSEPLVEIDNLDKPLSSDNVKVGIFTSLFSKEGRVRRAQLRKEQLAQKSLLKSQRAAEIKMRREEKERERDAKRLKKKLGTLESDLIDEVVRFDETSSNNGDKSTLFTKVEDDATSSDNSNVDHALELELKEVENTSSESVTDSNTASDAKSLNALSNFDEQGPNINGQDLSIQEGFEDEDSSFTDSSVANTSGNDIESLKKRSFFSFFKVGKRKSFARNSDIDILSDEVLDEDGASDKKIKKSLIKRKDKGLKDKDNETISKKKRFRLSKVEDESEELGSIVSLEESSIELEGEEVITEEVGINASVATEVISDREVAFTEAQLESQEISEDIDNNIDVIISPKSYIERVESEVQDGVILSLDRTSLEVEDDMLDKTFLVDREKSVDLYLDSDTNPNEGSADKTSDDKSDERSLLKKAEREERARLKQEAKEAEKALKEAEKEIEAKNKVEESKLIAQAKIEERARKQEERLAEERAKAEAKAEMEKVKNHEKMLKAQEKAAKREAKRAARRERSNKKLEEKKIKAQEKAKIEEVKKAERIANAQKKMDEKKAEIEMKAKQRAEKAEIKRLSHSAKVEAKRAQAQLRREEAERRAADRAEAEKRRNEERKLRRSTAIKRAEELEQRRIQRKAEKFGLVATATERKPVEKVGYTWDTESGYSYDLPDAKKSSVLDFDYKKYDLPEDLPRG